MPDTDRLQIQSDFGRALKDNHIRPEDVKPTAQVVDTFFNPNAGEQLNQLAHALGQVSPEVAQYGEVVAHKDQERDKATAEAAVNDAVRKGAKSYSDAVASGAIPASASPWYRLYAKNQMGKALASTMGSDFEEAAARDLAGATDIQQFDKYAVEFQDKWTKEHTVGVQGDPAFAQGFDPTANAVIANARANFAQDAGKNLQAQTVSSLIQNQAQIIRLGKKSKLSDEQIAEQLNTAAADAIAHGVRGDLVNQANSVAISNFAETSLDQSILGLGAYVKAGTGTLQDTAVFSKLSNDATPHIVSQKNAADSAAYEKSVRDREAARAETVTSAITALQENPRADMRPFYATLAAHKDYQAIESLEAHRFASLENKWKGDPAQFAHAMSAAVDPSGPRITKSHVSALIGNGDIAANEGAEIIGILDRREKEDKAEAAGKSLFKEPNYVIQAKALGDNFRTELGLKANDNPAYANARVALFTQFQALMVDPSYVNAKPQDKTVMADAVRQQIIQTYGTKSMADHANRTVKPNFDPTSPDRILAETFKREMTQPGGVTSATKERLRRRGLDKPGALHDFLVEQGVVQPPPPK